MACPTLCLQVRISPDAERLADGVRIVVNEPGRQRTLEGQLDGVRAHRPFAFSFVAIFPRKKGWSCIRAG